MIIDTIRELTSSRAVQLSSTTWEFNRAYRPRWALVAGILTIPIFGIGIVLLCTRVSAAFRVTFTEQYDGTTISYAGDVPAGFERVLARALESVDAQTPAVAATDTAAEPRTDTQATVGTVQLAGGAPEAGRATAAAEPAVWNTPLPSIARENASAWRSEDDDATVAGLPIESPRLTTVWTLRFDEARQVVVDSELHIGRDPAFIGTAIAVAIDDPGRSVSKVHFAAAVADDALEVWDLGSTNGTGIVRNGQLIELKVGRRERAYDGDEIAFGAYSARVERSQTTLAEPEHRKGSQ